MRLLERSIPDSGAIVIDKLGNPRRQGGQWPVTLETDFGFCLMRSGGFYREAEGKQEFVDVTTGHYVRADVEERFTHPKVPTYRLTFVQLNADVYAEQVEGAHDKQDWTLAVTSKLDMLHRAVLAACRHGQDPFEEADLLNLLLQSLPPRVARPGPSSQPATREAHRKLSARTREALVYGNLGLGLGALARLVGVSPHHLSRVFRQVTGLTLSQYRTQLRMRAMLDDLAAATGTLADLAAAHGFSDHAHLSRMIRRYHGEVPSALRTRLRQMASHE